MSLDSNFEKIGSEDASVDFSKKREDFSKFYSLIKFPFVKLKELYKKIPDEFYEATGW